MRTHDDFDGRPVDVSEGLAASPQMPDPRGRDEVRRLLTAAEIAAFATGKTVDRVEVVGALRGILVWGETQSVKTWYTDGTALEVVTEGGFYGTDVTPAEPADIYWLAHIPQR